MLATSQPKGWFVISGRQLGDRTLEEQLLGLAPALAEAAGKRVLDLGAAEGLIGIEFARAGAAEVLGIECNRESVGTAREQCAGTVCRVEQGHLEQGALPLGPWDIVLALAILHKLRDPAGMVAMIAACAPALVVVRLPGGSTGSFVTKNWRTACDLNAAFVANGFKLEQVLAGPRDEPVQYWKPC